nr:putative transcription factor lepb [Quercus suber]
MQPSQRDNRARRRRVYVSCKSCRGKKLKCDRQRPCSNCITRRLPCEYGSELPVSSGPATVSPHDSSERSSTRPHDTQARLRALELAVFGTGSAVRPSTHGDFPSSTTSSSSEHKDKRESADVDSRWLEGVGSRLIDALPDFSDALGVAVRDLEQFTWNAEHSSLSRQIAIPPREVALAYENWYKYNLDALIPVLHMPNMQGMAETTYRQLYLDKPCKIGSIALMLAVYASADLWGVRRVATSRTSDRHTEMSAILAKNALCAVEHARMSSQITIESLQATILLMFYLSHLEGWTSRARLLHSSAVTMARDLGLHKIDAANNRSTTTTMTTTVSQAQIIEAEIGRRIWWHITCSDW